MSAPVAALVEHHRRSEDLAAIATTLSASFDPRRWIPPSGRRDPPLSMALARAIGDRNHSASAYAARQRNVLEPSDSDPGAKTSTRGRDAEKHVIAPPVIMGGAPC
jgi:hypothetical protein